ncbi:MAG TPA: MFS transporter [Candidatus Angelobacter sp.]|jgi:MFS family permease|nr:MFS transporter [Candidatus Angelobacter sp.]
MSSASMPVTSSNQIAQSKIWAVILASSVGTMIEWYDFYIFGTLAIYLAPKFYPPGNQVFAYIAYLATFFVGFAVRPFGALFFGRIGDLVGRKYAFIVTLTIMGGATALVGALPTFATAGWFSPVILIILRILQGLALGGEYGGAAVYVAEHVPDNKRGFYTSFIQITATLGLFVSIAVILGTQAAMSDADFKNWGWRIPFLASLLLVTISLYIRLQMEESPIFQQIKSAGMTSAQPLKDAFTQWPNAKQVLISLFGATAGQGVVWYTGQFFALFFMTTILRVPSRDANIIVAKALLLGMPFFVLFGWLSDRIGRKKIIMAGLLLACLTYRIPGTNFGLYPAMQRAAGNNVTHVDASKNKVTGATVLTPQTLDATGKAVPAGPANNADKNKLMWLIFIQVIFVTMVYGPIAAFLVESFPAKVRYTSLSLPYHIGNGVFGGLVPLICVWIPAATGNPFDGLYYPIGIAALTFIVGSILLRETHGTRIWQEVSGK